MSHSLREKAGVKISLPSQAHAPNLGHLPPPGGPAQKVLNVSHAEQIGSNWCWAACCQMVFRFYGVDGRSQCQIVGNHFGIASCCGATVPSNCDLPAFPDVDYRALGINKDSSPDRIESELTFSQSQSQINNNDPFDVYILWDPSDSESPAHVMIVDGYSTVGGQFLNVLDPAPGGSSGGWVRYSELLAGYGGTSTARWLASYRFHQ